MRAVNSIGFREGRLTGGGLLALKCQQRYADVMLVLVIGPSGVGKDTLINGARAQLANRRDIVFATREITRALGRDAERHVPVDERTFAERDANGEYALSWRANGLGYGVSKAIEQNLAAGTTVVLNASRSAVDVARHRFAALRIVSIVAEPTII